MLQSTCIHTPRFTQLTEILAQVLELDRSEFEVSTPLLGAIPELDSMALMTLLIELESQFAMEIDGSSLTAEQFSTVGNLYNLISLQN